jgi:hypothetical protein
MVHAHAACYGPSVVGKRIVFPRPMIYLYRMMLLKKGRDDAIPSQSLFDVTTPVRRLLIIGSTTPNP